MKQIIVLLVMLLAGFASPAQTTDSVKTVTIKVGNIHCGNDMPTIKKQLLNQDGIDEVTFTEISGSSSLFTITYHSAATTAEQIEKAIESTPGCDDPESRPYKVKKDKGAKRNRS